MDNCHEETEKPPSISDSAGSCSPTRHRGIDFSDLYRIPIWRGGNLAGMGIHRNTCNNSLHQHKVVDLGVGTDD